MPLIPLHDYTATEDDSSSDGTPSERSGRLSVFSGICWLFMGLGVYRAWIEICFVGSFVDYPPEYPTRILFDLTCGLVLLVFAFFSHRLPALCGRLWPKLLAGLLMTASGAAGFVVVSHPQLAAVLSIPASVLGGIGIAVMILLWSELYGCLNPIRIALYYSLSQLVGAAVIWTFKGFLATWLALYTCALPALSLFMLAGAFNTVAPERRPTIPAPRFSFPWKPAAVVSVYAFAFGMQEANTYSFIGPHSGPGMMLAALVVVISVLLLSRWIDFGTIYAAILPTMMMAALLLSLLGSGDGPAAGFFVSLSYGSAEILIMTMVGSIAYRYGASAVWLFGIERAVRMIAMFAGREMGSVVSEPFLVAIVAVLAIAGFVLFVGERHIASSWGMVIQEDKILYEAALREALGRRCAELGKTCGLTQREEEVLLLLAKGRTTSDIGEELCIAYGTAKAHVRHIYRKLNVHSRTELIELVEKSTMLTDTQAK